MTASFRAASDSDPDSTPTGKDGPSAGEANPSPPFSGAILASMREGVLQVDNAGHIRYCNDAATHITGFPADRLIGSRASDLFERQEPPCPIDEAMLTRQPQRAIEEQLHRAGGSRIPVECYCHPLHEGPTLAGAVVTLHDISDRQAREAELRHAQDILTIQAYHDDLTGLPNRRYLTEQLEGVARMASDRGERAVVVLLDLDRFKDINDSFGHPDGDWLLQLVAGRLFQSLGPGEGLFRLGGDEYVILLEGLADLDDAGRRTHELQATLGEPFTLRDRQLKINASVGVAVTPDHGTDPEALLRNADAALHQAKKQGKGRYCLYTASLTEAATARLEVESALRRALTRSELSLHFQPQLDLETRTVRGAEALARWHHPEWGWVSPADFIPVAEETGLIEPLGAWALEEACRQAQAWRDAGLPLERMAVNVSPIQIEHGQVPATVRRALAASGLPPQCLELEVTENVFLGDAEQAGAVFQELSHLGVRLAVDDFGTGYSSLAYLKLLPMDQLKIDRSFVRDLPDDPNDTAIARAIIALGQSLGLELLAEGVETPEQEAFLRGQSGGMVQGFLYSRPLDATDFEAYLRVSAGL